jgi:hypothetical protein
VCSTSSCCNASISFSLPELPRHARRISAASSPQCSRRWGPSELCRQYLRERRGTFGSHEREHPIVHLFVLCSVVFLALATWAQHSEVMPGRGPVTSVASTVALALGTLTCCTRRAALIRGLLEMWIIAEPTLFGFGQISPLMWIYTATGAPVVAIAVHGSLHMHRQIARWEVCALDRGHFR